MRLAGWLVALGVLVQCKTQPVPFIDARRTYGPGEARAMAIQSDGKIVLAGTLAGDFLVVRLNPDLTLEKRVTIDFRGADEAFALALQRDGAIVVAGEMREGNVTRFAVARVTADLSPEWQVTSAIGGYDEDAARAVHVTSDGRIVAAGHARTGSTLDFAVARYDASGTLADHFTFGFEGGDEQAAALIESGNRLAVAGTAGPDFAVAWLSARGGVDARVALAGTDDLLSALARAQDGGLVLAGGRGLARLHPDGEVAWRQRLDGSARAAAVRFDSRIFVAGNRFALWRYSASGLLERRDELDLPGDALAMAFQSDGKLVLAGRSRGEVAVVRINP